MPFIGDEELLSFQEEIQKAKDEKDIISKDLKKAYQDLETEKKKGLRTNIFFGILSGLALGVAGYLLTSGTGGLSIGKSSVDMESLRAEIRESVIDSLNTNSEDFDDESDSDFDSENAEEDVKDGINNQKVYSVQVKALSSNKFPVMSTAIAGFATVDEYFKYSIGIFNNLEEAQDLRKELVKLGFRDAFVASYVNGKRKEIHLPE